MSAQEETGTLSRPGIGSGTETLAYRRRAGKTGGGSPAIVWFGGFKSDMTGTKATALDEWAASRGHAYVRFDYFGHGASSGDFEEGTIGRWTEDGLAVIRELTDGPLVLVGSSMGGWTSLLAALTLQAEGQGDRLKGMVLIAPAPDFTERLMWAGFSDEVRREIMETGAHRQPSDYDDEPYVITRRLIEEGREHLIMDKPIPIRVPVRILQGMKDDDVPWQHALQLAETLESDDVVYSLNKQGDHRLSTPADIARLHAALDEVCG